MFSVGRSSETMQIGSMPHPIFSTGSDEWEDFTFEHRQQVAFALLPQSFYLHAIYVNLKGPSTVEISYGGKRRRRRLGRGDVCIAPSHLTIDGAYVAGCDFLQLWVNPSVVDRASKALEVGDDFALAPVFGAVDPLIEQTICLLEEELKTRRSEPDCVNALVDTLATHLVRYYAKSTWTTGGIGGFPRYILDRTLDYIDSNLDRDFTLDEVARAVSIEPGRFVRAFRIATGMSLLPYINARREAQRRGPSESV